MLFPRDSLSALDLGAFGTIEDEERKEWRAHKLRTTEEQCAKFGVLSLSSTRSMKGPDGRINANAKTAKIGRIGLESIDDGDVSKRLQLPRRSENLSRVRGSTWTSGCTHIPKASHTHLCNNKTIPSPKFPAIHLRRIRSHDRTQAQCSRLPGQSHKVTGEQRRPSAPYIQQKYKGTVSKPRKREVQ